MSAARRRRRSRGSTAVAETESSTPATQKPGGSAAPIPMPEWRWRTFPVFFAFALGLFLGTWAGVAAGIASQGSDGTTLPMNLLFILSAVLLGLALSRFMTRWLISHQWVKPRARGKAARRR